MRIAELPRPAEAPLAKACEDFASSFGRVRLRDPSQLSARGVIAEALLGLDDVDRFLGATGDDFDSLFSRWAAFLFEGEYPVGSVGMLRTAEGGFVVEHVVLGGVKELLDGLVEAERLPDSSAIEARLVRIPEIYLTALALILPGAARSFLVLTPSRQGFSGRQSAGSFREVIRRLVAERRPLPPR